MPLLIDTFNVLHTTGVLPPDLAGIDLQGLVELLGRSRYRHERTTLVCDGAPKPGPGADIEQNDPRISIRFSGAGHPADNLIGQMIRMSSAPRRLTVVSSDHAIQRAARKRRCGVLTSEEFLSQLAHDAGLPAPARGAGARADSSMSEHQVASWMRVFDVEHLTDATLESSAQALKSDPQETPSRVATKSAPPTAPSSPAQMPPELPQLQGPVLPDSIVRQAEQMWQAERHMNPQPPGSPATPGRMDSEEDASSTDGTTR